MKDNLIPIFEKQIRQFVEDNRPPEHIRDQLDLGCRFENNVLELFDLRPKWGEEKSMMELPFAKARFIKSRNIWKVYWMRASGKWEAYDPAPEVKTLTAFFKVVKEDRYGAFWG